VEIMIELRYLASIMKKRTNDVRLVQSTNASAIKAVLELKKPRFIVAPAKELSV